MSKKTEINKDHEPIVQSTMLAGALAAILVVFLTVVGELHSPLKDFLKNAHYHHWVGKGIWAAGLFILVTAISYPLFKRGARNSKATITFFNWMLILGTLILLLFFTYEYLIHH